MTDIQKSSGVAKGLVLIDRVLLFVAAILLAVMMLLTTADVFGRFLFNLPLKGSYEINQILMALVVFASFPVATSADAHLRVGILTDNLTGSKARMLSIFVDFISAAVVFLIFWRLWEHAETLRRSQAVTGYLELPWPPLAYTMCVFAGITFIIVMIKFFSDLRGPAPADAVRQGEGA